MTDYKPGTVALIDTTQNENVLAFRVDVWLLADGSYAIDAYVTNVRPQIVLDPADPKVKAFLTRSISRTSDAVRDLMQEQLEPAESPVAEPTGAALVRDKDGDYMRDLDGNWIGDDGHHYLWRDLNQDDTFEVLWQEQP